jgi:hypothetical protein
MTRNDTLATIELTRATARDSSSMKVVAVMTMAFLPGTFIAALFSIPSLQWNTSSVVQDKFWVYWAFTLPLTALVFALWMMLTQAKELVKWWTLFQKTHGLRLTPQDNDFKTKGKDSSGLGSGLNQQLTSTSTPSRPGYKTWDV